MASIETPPDVEHRFGGRWTELKLDAVEYYLRFYTQALKDKPTPSNRFILWYIDAFAGTGDRVVDQAVGGLLDGIPVGTETVRKAGSAARALAIDPPFENFVFIERDPAHCAALERLKAQNPQREISCVEGDANKVIPAMFSQPPWGGNRSWQKRPHRAVVFLSLHHPARSYFPFILQWPTQARSPSLSQSDALKTYSGSMGSRHLVIRPAVEFSACSLFVFSAPLLEEKGRPRRSAT